MVRRDVAGAKIARAAAWLDDAAIRFGDDVDMFANDRERRDLAIFYLFLAIQECLDLAAHWVADAGWSPADDAASVFDELADRGAIVRDLADPLRGAAGLRNRIAHGYAMLDYRRVHREAVAGLGALRAFLAAVADAAVIWFSSSSPPARGSASSRLPTVPTCSRSIVRRWGRIVCGWRGSKGDGIGPGGIRRMTKRRQI